MELRVVQKAENWELGKRAFIIVGSAEWTVSELDKFVKLIRSKISFEVVR